MAVFSSVSDTDNATANCCLELTHHLVYRCLKVMMGPLHFYLSVTLYPQ